MSRLLSIVFGLSFLLQLGSAVAQVTPSLQAGVVRISAQGWVPKKGSGFIVRLEPRRAYILTAAHVVKGDPQPRIEFLTRRGKLFKARVLTQEEGDSGLALLLVDEEIPAGLTALSLTPSRSFALGTVFDVIGIPIDVGNWTQIRGSVASFHGRQIIFQAAVGAGISGGPLLREGKVIGMVTQTGIFGRAVPAASLGIFLENSGVLPLLDGDGRNEDESDRPEREELVIISDSYNALGAEVYIDDKKVGTMGHYGALGIGLYVTTSPGNHSISVQKDGYVPFEVDVTLEPGESRWIKDVKLVERPSMVLPTEEEIFKGVMKWFMKTK